MITKFTVFSKALALCVIFAAESATAATIVNINSRINTPFNPVKLFLTPGVYDVTPIGIADGGLYDAWLGWVSVTGCDINGKNCRTGWINEYAYSSDEFSFVQPTTGIFQTPLLALSNALPSSFSLATATEVDFYITDLITFDNSSGMSLLVSAVPEPVPEPTSTLSFVALSTLGAASTLKRKLKPSKSLQKETTKVS